MKSPWEFRTNSTGALGMANPPINNPHEMFKKFPLVPHHEIGETFADQLGLAMFDGTTLRIEFAVARMDEPKPSKNPTGERHVVCRMVLSTPCAIDLINQMQMIATQLANAGVLKTNPPPPPPPMVGNA
jgi:hypothetical protein